MSDDPRRPDPEEILGRMRAEASRAGKGSLKIYFGAAPGVGKTFAMLEAAQRLVKGGGDVVVGAIETHGRRETAELTEGLEKLPMVEIGYRGTALSEFDLAAALTRRPAVLLLDELAHTNAPGSVHKKRWQDVMDLLDAGIDVYTTLNVQHVESLNDVVREVTGVRVRETVPDAVLERADDIELVDLPPDELLARLEDGKVYVPEQAARAKERFFRRGNLLALRELALRSTAERVDADVERYRRENAIDTTWRSSERILVCVGPAPASAGLVRAARRMASGLRAPWMAVSVTPANQALVSEPQRQRLDKNLALAEALGAEIVRLTSDHVASAILPFAKKRNVTRIVIGKPTHPRLRDRLRGSLLDDVVRGSGTIEVHVTSGSLDEAAPREDPIPRAEQKAGEGPLPYVVSMLAVVAGTVVAWAARSYLDLADVVMIYLAAIVGIAVRFSRRPSILAAALSVAAFDFFFVPPFFTFAVTDTKHLLTFAMMLGLGLLISGLMLRIRRQEAAARLREDRTNALFALARELGGALGASEIARVAADHVEGSFDVDAAIFLEDPKTHSLAPTADSGHLVLDGQEDTVARWVLEHGRPAGRGTDTLAGSKIFAAPILSGKDSVGVAAVKPRRPEAALDHEQRSVLDGSLRQVGMALQRSRLAEQAKTAALRAKTEELRSTLLSAVSHDLRTPLAAITGAATTLLDPESHFGDAERTDLLTTICEEAERLERLVGNLLDMTRLESGGLRLRREWVPLEEIVGSALTRLERPLSGRVITTELTPDLPLLAVDPVLFEQVFVNLLENVAKYTPPGTAVAVRAIEQGGSVVIDVEDHGLGFAPGAEERIFEKFYREAGVGRHGVGLGLAICRGIVEAHGGTIRAENLPAGGARFRVILPEHGVPPTVPEEAPVSAGETRP